ncbi:APC family permease [Vampirovibrio sp.]|uniref:APC family permease n=1 Tax=Vampirovibrio sp. TaxID=2717857 RepID=UPI0035933C55
MAMARESDSSSEHGPNLTPQGAAGQGELLPRLGWFSAACIVAGSMVGSGIFIVSSDIARTVGTGGWLMAIWVFAGLLTLLGAVSYGKLAAYMPKAGGQYVFLREAWGELPAFLYGWNLLTVIQTGFLAAVAVAFAKYLGVLVPAISSAPLISGWPMSLQSLLAVAVLLVLTLYNSTGIQNGARLQNVFTSLKVLALALLIGVGLAFGNRLGSVDWSFTLPAAQAAQGDWLTLFAFASVGALFSSDAWNYVTFIGGEVKNPAKNLPKALLIGTITVTVLYLLANLAYLNLLSLPQIQNAPEDRVATVAMDMIFPGAGVLIMAGIILISTFGCLNGMLLAGARVFYAMAKDGLLFKKFGEVHPKTHSPNFCLWVQFVWASGLALSGTYGQLLDYIVFSTLLFYILTMLGLIRLGRKIPVAVQMTRKRDYAVPVTYIAGASFIAFFLLFGDFFTPDFVSRFQSDLPHTKFFTSVAGILLTALGLPVYWVWKKTRPASV